MQKEVLLVSVLVLSLIVFSGCSSIDSLFTKTCGGQGGSSCSSGEYCTGVYLEASDTDLCCSEWCELNTCTNLGGVICSPQSVCAGQSVAASDGNCCIGSCELNTCAEQGGDICDRSESCQGNLITASDTNACCSTQCIQDSCESQGGVVCLAQERCTGNILSVAGEDSCCSGNCQRLTATNTCNYNTLCEGWESPSCVDCQCSGTVCGGICYGEEGTCCNNRNFIPQKKGVYCGGDTVPENQACAVPGTCTPGYNPLIVFFDIPEFYELNVPLSARVIVMNNAPNEVRGRLTWTYNQKFKIVGSDGRKIEESYQTIELKKGQSVEFMITITPQNEFNLFTSPLDGFSRFYLTVVDDQGYGNLYTGPFMKIVKMGGSNLCGGSSFAMKGSCISSVFYPDAVECTGTETGTIKDYLNLCAQGFSLKDSLRYDQQNDLIKVWGDVRASGTKKIFVARINDDFVLNISGIQSWTETFFDAEAQKILGKNMVDLSFTDRGRVSVDWSRVSNTDDLRQQLERQLSLSPANYDFIIGYTEKAHSKIIFNESGGIYVGKGVILIDSNDTHFLTVAHEMNHGFGAPDLYFNTSTPTACTAQFINDIMCGFTILAARTVIDPPPDEMRLNTAPFIGWGDLDADGIVDVDDQYVLKIPSWSQGIEILEARPIVATQSSPGIPPIQVLSIDVYVLDKKTQKLVPALITIDSPLFSNKFFSTTGMLFYTPKITLPTTPLDITVTAEYGRFTDSRVVRYDPASYRYTPSRYDPKVYGP